MKAKISYVKTVTEIVNVPKEWEFYFKKDEDDWTDKEWRIWEKKSFLDLPYYYEGVEVEDVI